MGPVGGFVGHSVPMVACGVAICTGKKMTSFYEYVFVGWSIVTTISGHFNWDENSLQVDALTVPLRSIINI